MVEVTTAALVPPARENSAPDPGNQAHHLEGCRIGFDAGGSDRKVAAMVEGKVVFSDEVIWHPKLQQNPQYHYDQILSAMQAAAAHMPRVDAIGVSAAGIYVNNRVRVASLFLKVPEDLFDKRIKDIFLNIQKAMGGVPLVVANDGDVAALAGAMDLQAVNVLGLAMGTSEAGGYIDAHGNITGWLNELAFVPVDFNPLSAVDEWSGDYGCGVKYFSQEAVIKLAPAAGLFLEAALTPAEKLQVVQRRLAAGEVGARRIYESMGCYLGYAVAAYAEYYPIDHVLVLGRVTSGEGGNIIMEKARQVLIGEFPGLAGKIALHLPGEADRRMGQAVAAASLPELGDR